MRWERTSWTKVALEPAERLRYALIVPRLLAPHGNRGVGPDLRPEEALALAVQVRLANLHDYTQGLDHVPMADEMGDRPEWAWRLVGAFLARVEDGDPGPLVRVTAEAPAGPGEAAATVAAACALLDRDRIEEALRHLDHVLATGKHGRVDRAWLLAQRARIWRQVGRVEEAVKAARLIREDLASVEDDPTADAISAAAAALIGSTDLTSPSDFEAAVVSGDTVAAWWRSQEIVTAGNEIAERSFSEWARDTKTTWSREDGAANRLLATEIETTHAADQGGWANRQLAIGRDMLLRVDRHSAAEYAAEGIAALRRSGNASAVRLGVSRLLHDGPAAAVAMGAASIEVRHSTHTGALADLSLLEQGGDVLDVSEAARLARELIELSGNPDEFAERITPTFAFEMQLIESLGGVILAAGPEAQRELISRLPGLPPQRGALVARAWAGLLWKVPPKAWTRAAARAAARDASRHDPTLARALRGVAWRHGQLAKAREELLAEALNGSLLALGELGPVTAFSEAQADQLIASVGDQLGEELDRARDGSTRSGGSDPGEALAVLDLWHSEVANWEPLVQLLGEPTATPSMKRRTLVVLAGGADRIPEHVRARMKPHVRPLTRPLPERPPPFQGEPDLRGPALDLAVAIGAVAAEEAYRQVFAWLGEDADQRRWAAQVALRLGGCETFGVLAALASDHDPTVRAAAAAALATRLGEEPGAEEAVRGILERAVRDPGVAVPEAVARALASVSRSDRTTEELRAALLTNLSATVRVITAEEAGAGADSDTADIPEPGVETIDNPYTAQRLKELRAEEEEL
jgi:hypothetical protein